MSLVDPVEQPESRASADREWWRGAVIYQIYPRSFQDSSSDGIGDLAGIIHRLKHVADLGVDAIWISPFYPSPMLDFGYDVSDYTGVDPMFGTLGDFDALIERAHELGLKVLIDLVLSHTSDQHPWFHESRTARDGHRADWYVWADAKPDGTPPNNWLSVFGGPAWEWDTERMQYYLHNFLAEQPDLNLHNPEVQDALLDVARFWLARGVDGFRLDTVNFFFHNPELTDNPPLEQEKRNDTAAPKVNPYNFQLHVHDKNQPQTVDFLRRFRAVLDEQEAATSIGEVGESHQSLELQAAYTNGGDKLHMCYSFTFLNALHPSATMVAGVIEKFEQLIEDGWGCWAFSNHDVPRHPSRWHLGEEGLRVYAALLLSLRGSVCLYQGEELGLTEAYVPYEDLQDPYGIRFWPKFKGRDGCRTPLPWSHDVRNGGFSDARPWLPLAPEHLARAVDRQEGDPGSTLAFYRAMIAFRKAQPALRSGAMKLLRDDDVLAFLRGTGETRVFCAFNLTDGPQPITLPEGRWTACEGAPFRTETTESGLVLPPFQAHFAGQDA